MARDSRGSLSNCPRLREAGESRVPCWPHLRPGERDGRACAVKIPFSPFSLWRCQPGCSTADQAFWLRHWQACGTEGTVGGVLPGHIVMEVPSSSPAPNPARCRAELRLARDACQGGVGEAGFVRAGTGRGSAPGPLALFDPGP